MPMQAQGEPDLIKKLVVNTMLQLLYSWGRPSTHCTGGWMGLRAGLERRG
jgi:hypothetical protein